MYDKNSYENEKKQFLFSFEYLKKKKLIKTEKCLLWKCLSEVI